MRRVQVVVEVVRNSQAMALAIGPLPGSVMKVAKLHDEMVLAGWSVGLLFGQQDHVVSRVSLKMLQAGGVQLQG